MKLPFLMIGFAAASLVTVPAQTFKVIHSFTNSPDGANPYAGLVLGDSTLYGTTVGGGISGLGSGLGTVFKVNTNGTGFTVLKHCTNDNAGEDIYPYAGLVLNGSMLYGTFYGSDLAAPGVGSVYQVDTNGTGYAILKQFPNSGVDGMCPRAGLVFNGNTLYGTTRRGNTNGTVFKVDTDGTHFTTLKKFPALVSGTNSDGANPYAGLVLDGGTLYGTTKSGGISGNGVVFKVNTNGTGFAVLKHFSALNNSTNGDGANPYADLVLGGSTLYGTTCYGGVSSNGVVFKVNTNGTGFTILKSFSTLNNGTNNDGANPYAGLLLSGSTLYGTAAAGGSSGKGTVFKVKTDGTGFAVLKHFPALSNGTNSDGAIPYAGLISSGGTLYGTTYHGGSSDDGVVFSLTVPPEIPVNDAGFGIRTNCFGFNVTGISNQVVVMEACTNLASPTWVPLQTNTLGADPLYFSDPAWTNYPGRFYRVRTQ